ncbi:MAG: CoA transferase [Candidatus Reddybacter sp.]
MFKSKDGYIILIAFLRRWPDFCEVMGMPELIDDPRFIDDAIRAQNQDQLTPIIEQWLQTQESDAATIKLLGEKHIPVAPILSIKEVMEHAHKQERGTVRTVSDRGAGSFEIPGMPLRFSAFDNDLELETPYLGEHNNEVLSNLLGMDSAKINTLTTQGILVNEPLPDLNN